MHQALQLEEVLSTIFIYFAGDLDISLSTDQRSDRKDPKTLAALARTCRAFKEPALDALWMVLPSLRPLTWYLPQMIYEPSSSSVRYFDALIVLRSTFAHFRSMEQLEFSRPLTQTDWDIFRAYARRIKSIHDFAWENGGWGYFQLLSEPPTEEPLFPKLRCLGCKYNALTMHLLDRPLPSLVSLFVEFETFPFSLKSFPRFSPNIKNILISFEDDRYNSGNYDLDCLCRWKNLSVVDICYLHLTMDDLVQLSRIPLLTHLEFSLSARSCSDLPLLSFSNLQNMNLASGSLDLISQLLLRIRLPVITEFQAEISACPSRKELITFSDVLTSNARHTIKRLSLTQRPRRARLIQSGALALCFQDLQYCMALRNLVHLAFDVEHATVNLTDTDLLTLASAWPKLEHLRISSRDCWHSEYGITPGGLVRLWQICRSLSHIELRLDTRGYTEEPSSEALESLLTLPPTVMMNILDAAIEADSVPAISTFFSGIAARCQFWLRFWHDRPPVWSQNMEEYVERWHKIRARLYGPRVYSTSEWWDECP